MAVLAGGLEGRVAGEDAVHVGVDPLENLFDLLRVAVGRRFDQLLVNVARHVRFEQLLQQGAQIFYTTTTGEFQ